MSFNPQQPVSQNWYQNTEPPPKSGCSKGCLIALLVTGGLLMIGCCVGVYVIYSGVQQVAQSFSADPAVATSRMREIVDGVPEGFQPKGSIDMKVPFVGTQLMTMVIYEADNQGGMLMVCEFNGEMFQQDPEKMKLEMQKSVQQQTGQGNLQEITSKTVTYNVRGKPCEFKLIRGMMEEGGNQKEIWQAMGMIEGKRGPTMVMVLLDAKQYTEEQVQQVIEGIR